MIIARQYVLMDYDIADELVEKAVAITPGIESPTVSPLHEPGWSAVRSMVPRKGHQPHDGRALGPRRPRHPGHRHPRVPTVNASKADVPEVVEARPVVSLRIGYALAVVVFATFVVIALVMRRANDGVPFTYKDQLGTALVGSSSPGCA